MSSVHRLEVGQEYSFEREYTDDEKRQVTPAEMVRWLNVRTFGVPNPGSEESIRPLVRAHTLAFWKKAISFHMPDRLHGWRSGSNDGNPTKSVEVNDFIKRVKKLEARKQGADSKTRRPMQETEFRRLHEIFKSSPHADQQQNNTSTSIIWRYGMPALINFQFHLIARIDDTTQVIMDHIRVHDNFENALKTRLNWSKNVQDERDAPWQVILGSMNPIFCNFISLGLWLEMNLRLNPSAVASPYLFSFSDETTIPAGGKKAKDIAQCIFGQNVFKRNEFQSTGLLGSHSIRKFASTHVRKCGVSKDDKDIRGRWKGRGRVSDVYDDVELPYPDCKVAEKLCIGGPCFYLIDNSVVESTAMKTFILTKVVANIRRRLPDSACLVLGKAIVWLIFSSVANNFISSIDCDRVKSDLVETGIVVEDGKNPISKMPVLVSGDQGMVYIDEIPIGAPIDIAAGGDAQPTAGGDDVTMSGAARTLGGNQMRNYMLQLQSGILSLRRENIELRNEMERLHQGMERGFATINGNIKRVAMQPVRRLATTAVGIDLLAGAATGTVGAAMELAPALAMMNPPSLMPNPKSLFDLWDEYLNGVGGRKPARLFSQTERGRVKYKYTRRKVVWDIIKKLVDLGHTSQRAIDMIYEVYGGQTSVTDIINRLRKDKRNGTLNPNLRG
jgi:hypothetical protein